MKLSILDRYIGTTMLKATGMALLILVILLALFGLIDEMDDVGTGSYGLRDAFLVAMLEAPGYVFEVFPVAALIGSLIGLGAMASHGELMAMRGSGFSLRQIVLAVMKTGLAMMLLIFLFGELVAPASEEWANQHRTEKLQGKVTLKTRYGFWARDGRAFVNIRGILPGARLEDIYIYEFGDNRDLKLATHAERAEHHGDHWLMFGIRQSQIGDTVIERRELAQARWDSLLDPALLNAIVVQPNMLRIDELYRYIDVMRENGQTPTDYEVAFWSKLATPFATLVMLFIAVPFVLAHQRFVSIGQRIFLGIALGMAFYLFNRAMSYVAVVYNVNALVSALLPALAFLAIGIAMMRRVR
ncbi:MAG: LPS export ABC transporter permease LptG [Gammaproteobacteria bacterium]|nr:LPS export ABC transporter permease LptG [Gammaproteobacteria bacterium]MCP5299219.1 LPS export ABC transporter permease LptG [Chromatiaceae bacterium]